MKTEAKLKRSGAYKKGLYLFCHYSSKKKGF